MPVQRPTKENRIRGRGTASLVKPRYQAHDYQEVDDGWEHEMPDAGVATTVTVEHARSIISRNQSPDVPFEQSLNPYRGCEHGCIYCYARPTHAYLDLSPGLDFETRLFVKPEAPALLRRELGRPGYRCRTLALGSNTDPYQPVERRWQVTREVLQVLLDARHPVTIVTKSALVERDIDILSRLAAANLAQVYLSITTLENDLARHLEPRAVAPRRRLEALSRLHGAGIPVGVLFAPVIPFINDAEMETILERVAAAGAESAGYVMLRLPQEVRGLFREWLELHEPGKARHVMSIINDLHGGRDYDSGFYRRMRGRGNYAALMQQRFQSACRRFGLNRQRRELDTSRFQPPGSAGQQGDLFSK